MNTHISDSIIVPSTYSVRLSLRPPQAWVVIAPPDVTPTPEGVTDVPTISTVLTHDVGVNWPDTTGTEMARRVLAAGGCVLMVFNTLNDALGCHGRLLRERAG